jgi:hypothetical protein
MKYFIYIFCIFTFSACIKDAAPPTGKGNGLSINFSGAYNITQNSASFSGEVTGGISAPAVTSKGYCWDTVPNPTIKYNAVYSASGKGSIVGGLTNLPPGKKYYVRGFYKISYGTFYSNEISFTTLPAKLATVSSITVTSLTRNSLVASANVTATGGSYTVSKGICWTTSGLPTIANNNIKSSSIGAGAYSVSITGLNPNTTYTMRAFATNEAGTAYGSGISFKTPS